MSVPYPQDSPPLDVTQAATMPLVPRPEDTHKHSTNTTNKHFSAPADFVYPLSKPCFHTHRYNPADLQPVLIDRGPDPDTTMASTIDYTHIEAGSDTSSPTSSVILRESVFSPGGGDDDNDEEDDHYYVFQRPNFDRSESPSFREEERQEFPMHSGDTESEENTYTFTTNNTTSGTPSIKTVKTHRTNPSTHSQAGSIYPRTPPQSHRDSRKMAGFSSDPTPPVPDVVKLSRDQSEMTLCSRGSNAPVLFPDHLESITTSVNGKLYSQYTSILQVYFLVRVFVLPVLDHWRGFAHFKVQPHILELEGDHFLFATGSPNFHKRMAPNRNITWAPYSKDRIKFWVTVSKVFGVFGMFVTFALPTLLVILLIF